MWWPPGKTFLLAEVWPRILDIGGCLPGSGSIADARRFLCWPERLSTAPPENCITYWLSPGIFWILGDLSPLAELKNLKLLRLIRAQVSDLSPLVELKNLETLGLHNTPVSEEQVQELRQALPNCNIRHWRRIEK